MLSEIGTNGKTIINSDSVIIDIIRKLNENHNTNFEKYSDKSGNDTDLNQELIKK